MSLEPGVFFTINSPCVSVTVFRRKFKVFCLNKNWVQSLRECSQIISFSLLKIKIGCDLGQLVFLMVQIAIQLLDVPKALHELCSANPGTPRFYLNTLAWYQLIHHASF